MQVCIGIPEDGEANSQSGHSRFRTMFSKQPVMAMPLYSTGSNEIKKPTKLARVPVNDNAILSKINTCTERYVDISKGNAFQRAYQTVPFRAPVHTVSKLTVLLPSPSSRWYIRSWSTQARRCTPLRRQPLQCSSIARSIVQAKFETRETRRSLNAE